MKKYISRSLWSCCTFGAFLLAALTARAQLQYPPGIFDVGISFGCLCTCWCETNRVDTNNPISVFLAANPPLSISASTAVAPVNQMVPPHWTEFLPLPNPPYDPNASLPIPAGSQHTFDIEGWTWTTSTLPGYTSTLSPNNQSSTWLPVSYNPGYPLAFQVPFNFYAHPLPPKPGSIPSGQLPLQDPTAIQPYPQDVNVAIYFSNGEYYYMEQQLAVGFYPYEDYPPPLETEVNYVETNGLLSITLLCTNGLPIDVSSATIKATLLPDNIPGPLSLSAGGVFWWDIFMNWSWPLTPADMIENPPSLYNSPGAAGTVQASLYVTSQIVNTPLLVRANRAYALTIGPLYVIGYNNNGVGEPVFLGSVTITNTGLIPPCTNTLITMSNNLCSGTWTNPTAPCFGAVTGVVNMLLGPPAPNNVINMDIFNGPGGSYGYQAPPLTSQPGNYLISVPGSDAYEGPPNYIPYHPYEMQAAMGLGSGPSYEYFVSPVLANVYVPCGITNNLTNVFVMCPSNPGIVQGTITLNGCVDTNYFSGIGALNYLQFASTYNGNGVPQDPTGGNPLDPTLQDNNTARPFIVNSSDGQYLSYIQATGGLPTPSATPLAPPLASLGGGSATTEFKNPGAFTAPNAYSGNYSLQMAGLEGQASYWSPNDLHLVFGSPVNLVYDIIETTAPYTNVNISCGTIVTNNITHCFGLVTVGVTNLYPGSLTYTTVSLHVSGTGPGYTVGPFTVDHFPFQFHSMTHNEADVPLFLPEGTYQYTATAYGLTFSDTLNVTNYFTVRCCTNPCLLVVDCPTNKAVSCATNWTFDLPTVHTNCCGTNYSISVFDNVTISNGPCSATNTRTWLITDCNGHTSFCSQTVNVAPPSSYTLTLQPGYNLIANQLNHTGGNSAQALFPNNGSHDFDQLLFYGCTNTTTYYFDFGSPSGFDDAGFNQLLTAPTLSPGQGVFYFNNTGSPETFTFTGTPVCPPTPVPLCPCGTETLVSYKLDCLGTYEGITGLQPQQGVEVRRWNGSGYTVDTFNNGAWTLGPPVLNVGEAAFILIPCPINPTNPIPIHIGTLDGTTAAATFNLGAGNGTYTFSNGAWSVSGGNYNYSLQTITNLLSTNWITVCNAIPTIGYTFTNAGPINFYRLQRQTNQ